MRLPKYIHKIIGLEENELMDIFVPEFFERFNIKSITTSHLNHDNLICCKAFDQEFIVKPYRGKPDWELLLKRLERGMYNNFVLIERPSEGD